jgi:hypothetical protein
MENNLTAKQMIIGYGSIAVGIALGVYVLNELFKSNKN